VGLNSAWTAVVESYLTDCHSNDSDSQAIHGSNGPGPFTITNNTLEAAGENVMFGGDDSRSVELLPSDITLVGNTIDKPDSWRGVWTAKNLVEFKVGIRVLVSRNTLSGSWTSGQTGFALLFKTVNQGGSAPWSETRDVTVTHNSLANAERGISLAAKPEATTAVPMTKVLIQDMDLTGISTSQPMTVEDVADLTIDHNTMPNGVQFNTGTGALRFTMTANAIHVRTCPADWYPCGGMVWSADGHGIGDSALAYHTGGGTNVSTAYVVGNLIDGDRVGADRTPSTNGTAATDAGARP
jgi:hypothetical protein